MKQMRLVVLSGVFSMFAACSAEYELTDFSPPDLSFISSMPATPQYKSKSIAAPDGIGTVHSYSVTFDDVIYGVSVIDLPEETKEDIKHPTKEKLMYAAATQGMLASNGWRLIEEVGDQMDSTPSHRIYGQRVTAATADNSGTATIRIFIRDGRAYQAMIVVPKKSSYNQGVYSMRFLESFKLTQ